MHHLQNTYHLQNTSIKVKKENPAQLGLNVDGS